MKRVHNFSAGPAVLPLSVLERAQNELVNYQDKGSSIIEMSHRGPEYTAVHEQATARLKQITGADEDWDVMFLQGGASMQFLQVPYNFLNEDRKAVYIDTGSWSAKAIKEAKMFGRVDVPFSGKDENYTRLPEDGELDLTGSGDAQYVHFTSNNTIFGTQFAAEPDADAPLVCDASSDFLSRPLDLSRYGLIYAGAQKNLGPSGVTVVMIRKSFLDEQRPEAIPTILNYKTHVGKLFHTPSVFAVYMVNYVLEWILDAGGLSHFETVNEQKAARLYEELDRDDFYRGTVDKGSRSRMNVTFRIHDTELEPAFLKEAAGRDLVALKGHRSVGGIRASIYNACPEESVEALIAFMKDFRAANG